MWGSILDIFERHTLFNKLTAPRKFYTATMPAFESMHVYTNPIRF